MAQMARQLFLLRRRGFLAAMLGGAAAALLPGCGSPTEMPPPLPPGVRIPEIQAGEDLLAYITRQKGGFDADLYRGILGAANEYKQGDEAIGVAAADELSRQNARTLLSRTRLKDLDAHPLVDDAQYRLIQASLDATAGKTTAGWTLGELKTFLLQKSEDEIKAVMAGLSSDVIGCIVKLLSNEELIAIGQKVFNPLPGSKLGAKGYMGARIQPNSPTDNLEDIQWQVWNGWAFAVGDVVLGCNPVSSDFESVAAIERMLHDIRVTFGLTDVLPHCVLSHIDIQSAVEKMYPGETGIWFQSLAGNDAANAVFDVSVQKMLDHAAARGGKYGLYFETGQGADFTNGADEGTDMVVLEARKYGFARALKQKVADAQDKAGKPRSPWLHVNDVAGFIGPEVFRFKEQLVRCCLEDIVMGKLHGIFLGLDICSTLHMDVSLDDLDWCIDRIMPANPGYLMGLPTKNDPMLGYLTTAYQDHVRIREKFGFKVNDAMWDFFKTLGVIDANGKPTAKFGDPIWIYLQYLRKKGDMRTEAAIYAEGKAKLAEIRGRGVPIAEGHGKQLWDLDPALDKEIRTLYEDSKAGLWVDFSDGFLATIPNAAVLHTRSEDRKDYIWHPPTGERLDDAAVAALTALRKKQGSAYNVQIVISDGLCSWALSDSGHLAPYLTAVRKELDKLGYRTAPEHIVLRQGRVRAGYHTGEVLFGGRSDREATCAILHLIGERPGSGHHAYSVYITSPAVKVWSEAGKVDHNITKVVSGIADTALKPEQAAADTARILNKLAPPA